MNTVFKVATSFPGFLSYSSRSQLCSSHFSLISGLILSFDFFKPGESSEIESEEEDDESGSTSQDDKEMSDSGRTTKPGRNAPEENKPKPRDDLVMYEKFFPELFEFQVGTD